MSSSPGCTGTATPSATPRRVGPAPPSRAMTTSRSDDLLALRLRSSFVEAVDSAVRGSGAAEPLSVLVLDVDRLGAVNDAHGRAQGDDVLVEVSGILRRNLRTGDHAALAGGDEFIAILPGATAERAREVAERIAAAVRGHTFRVIDGVGSSPVTVSIGVASFPDHDGGEALLAAAERALAQVKRRGRDGVAVAPRAADEPTHLALSIERFVGRTRELQELSGLLDDAAAGRPRVVAISGEAGVGKTTLISRLEPEVRLHGGSLVVGRCREAGSQSPYAPWAEVVAALRRIGDVDTGEWQELPRVVPALGANGGGTTAAHSGSRYRLLDEIAHFLRLAARRRPLVVVIDDVQWADSATWDALETVTQQLDGDRILVCLTIRSEEAGGEPLERRSRLARSAAFREIPLPLLTRDELKQWMEAAFHRQDVGREMLAFLYRQTQGNPLLVVQVLRTLLDEGAMWDSGERWEWRPVSELRLPLSVTDLIARRLSRLSPPSHALLGAAAVVGREFDLELAAAAADAEPAALLQAVDEGGRASLVRPAPERGADRYAFAHALLAEALREAMPPRQRRRVHQRVAEALARRTPDAHAEIATHYDRAGDAPNAYRTALLAAAAARKVYAHQEATEFLRLAERHATTPPQLAEVRAQLAEIAEALGRYDEAEALCGQAIDWFAGEGDAVRALPLRRMRERLRGLLGRPAAQMLEACLALDAEARALGEDGERVALLTMLSQTHGRLGDAAAAEALARECVALAERVGDPSLLADSVNRLGVTLEGRSLEGAMECYRRALALYEAAGDVRGQASCHNNLGIVLTHRGEWEAAQEALARAIVLGRRAGTPDLWGLFSLNLGVMQLKSGEYDRARELFGEALAIFAEVKNSERQLYALYNLAHLDRERGEYESAAELYDVARSLARRIGQSDVELGAVAGAGLARLRQGKHDEAAAAYAETTAHSAARREWFQGRELIEALAVQVEGARGDPAGAAARFDRAQALADGMDVYSAIWLGAECAEVLRAHDPAHLAAVVARYAERAATLGGSTLRARYESLAAEPAGDRAGG